MMKRFLLLVSILWLSFSFLVVHPALAQTEPPPAGPLGEIRGTILNRNTGEVLTQTLDVMLHVLDQDFADRDMKHAQSTADGTFSFSNISFDESLQYLVMATYDNVTYSSEVTPVDMQSMQVVIDVPVYESTKDLSGVQIDQMHVVFNVAEDGLETREIYVVSSRNERTVKDVYPLDEGKSATLEFPLPVDADYVFFKPNDQDRFIKIDGGFADTNPLLPENQPTQFMVSYLVPYQGKRVYSYMAPLNVSQVNLLIPNQAGLTLQGSGLANPETITLEDGKTYKVYSYYDLNAGQTLELSISGSTTSKPSPRTANIPIAIGIALLGLLIIGAGIWWWYGPAGELNVDEVHTPKETLDDLILQIATLDEQYEQQGDLSPEAYQQLRKDLMGRAKSLM